MSRREIIHFLHIAKTGGSAIKFALKDHTNTSRYQIVLHKHKTHLPDIPEGEKIIFFLRDPIGRFISGFYSRQRKGLPRYEFPWTENEKIVFEEFSTPDELANGLAEGNRTARLALNRIRHLKRHSHWYRSIEYFHSRVDDILFIGFQETLDQDFENLKSILNIPSTCQLPNDDLNAHKNPVTSNMTIQEPGLTALLNWYEDDAKFISLCKKLMLNKSR